MKIVNFSSGSKGNTTYIETKNAKILIDIGNNCKYVVNCLEQININPKDIDGIIITHIHKDHVAGLNVFLKKYNTKVYLSLPMLDGLPFIKNYELIDKDDFQIKDIDINILKTSHDTEDSNGYIINNKNKSIVNITDTGYINNKYDNILKNRDVYLLESNHDIEMLQNSSYPFELRKRILSDKGHLSNEDSAKYLTKYIGNNTKYILLAHLSEENNTKELAYNTLKNKLEKNNIKFNNIIVLEQNCISKEIIIW